MLDPQRSTDPEENTRFGDSKSCLFREDNSSPTRRRLQSPLANSIPSINGNLDRRLLNDLVDIVPLVEHLIDQKDRSSFTRRGSAVYTKTPSRESLLKKAKKKDPGVKDKDDENSMLSSKAMGAQRDELIALREQVEDLQRKLLEKDELLISAEVMKDQMKAINGKVEELERQLAERNSSVKSVQLQLSDAKIKLAEKQAAWEKAQWEAKTMRTKAKNLQEQLNSVEGDISLFTRLFDDLRDNNSDKCSGDYDIVPYQFGHLPFLDDLSEAKMQKMEEAEKAYMAAVATAKERQDEESIAAAAGARLHLQSYVFSNPSTDL